MVTVEQEPSIYELRADIENRWCFLGALGGAAVGLGLAMGGVEVASQVATFKELSEPILRFSIDVVGLAGGFMLGIALGADPIGRWRADVAYPLPRRYHPLPPSSEFIRTQET